MGRGISVRFKVLVLSALVLAAFLGAAELILMRIIAPRFMVVDQDRAGEHISMASAVLIRDLRDLDILATDWAEWDDTYAYVVSRSSAYETSNLVVSTFKGAHLDTIAITDPAGAVVWSGDYDSGTGQLLKPTTLLSDESLERLRAAMDWTDLEHDLLGLWNTPRGPLMIAARPILTSNGKGPARGLLIMGRLVSGTTLDEIGALLGSEVDAIPTTHPDLPAGARAAVAADSGIATKPGPVPGTITAYAAVTDVLGDPVMVLRSVVKNHATPIGHNALITGVTLIAVTGVVLIAAVLICLQCIILSPLSRLTNHIRQVTSSGNLTTTLRLNRNDELGRLAEVFGSMQQRIARLAYFDTLTGLPNRRLLEDRAEHLLRIASRAGQRAAFLFLDLDGFKAVNDNKGHAVGDSLLQAVGTVLTQIVRDSDTVGRLGGDEFVIVMHNPAERPQVGDLAERILKRFRQPFQTSAGPLFVGVSIGICQYPDDGQDFRTLLAKADSAMYQAKNAGGARSAFPNNDSPRQIADRTDRAHAFGSGIFSDQVRLMFQPQVDLRTGSQIRHEALVRWNHPDRDVVRAVEFIHLADSGTLLARLDAWALRAACDALVNPLGDGPAMTAVAVNVSPRHLIDGNLINLVHEVLTATGVPPSALVLEIAVGGMLIGRAEAIRTLEGLRAAGVAIAVDGFGFDRTALGDLQHLPVDIIKVHAGIIHAAPKQAASAAIVRAIVALGQDLSLEIVAEGVETEEQLAFIREAGCGTGQGDLLGPAS